jgi:predicted Ser/Thr protein kinase
MVSLTQFANNNNLDDYKKLHEELGFEEYINRCYNNPKLARNSHQRIYDMITSFGTEEIDKHCQKRRCGAPFTRSRIIEFASANSTSFFIQ